MSSKVQLGLHGTLHVLVVGTGLLFGSSTMVYADTFGDRASNLVSGGISGTRHNLTQQFSMNGGGGSDAASASMSSFRNNYGEVCVYCHTPHGSNSNALSAGMPLWNRTVKDNPYELYNITTMEVGKDQAFTDPGHASLTCLSCHDGITAIDSIINMPGSGGYNQLQEDDDNDAWLTSEWSALNGGVAAGTHGALNESGCLLCHRPEALGGGTPSLDFENFVIGGSFAEDGSLVAGTIVDLRDDHPVGVLYPTTFGPSVDFHEPSASTPELSFFDLDGDGSADKNEIRLYNSGEGYEVECASCHDPHGVPDTTGSEFIPSFLRVNNTASTLCQSCHDK